MDRAKLRKNLEEYIALNYVEVKPFAAASSMAAPMQSERAMGSAKVRPKHGFMKSVMANRICEDSATAGALEEIDEEASPDFEEEHESKLAERMEHLSDTFSQYLMYLIKVKNLENADVYKHALVDKKTFSKIKNNEAYHPQKLTALCLCIGARLNLDETKDLLARAGYALSPCDKTDIIFSYFIENEIYDMIELDIQLEEHGLQCIIA